VTLLQRLFVVATVVLLAACSGQAVDNLRNPVPEALATQSQVAGYRHIRYWGDNGDGFPPELLAEISAQQEASGIITRDRDFLAISGGGSAGAFGAGIMVGWTAAGTRPEFAVVTGVSTGSLIAPFAFIGPQYDDKLREAYTEVSAQDIFRRKSALRVI